MWSHSTQHPPETGVLFVPMGTEGLGEKRFPLILGRLGRQGEGTDRTSPVGVTAFPVLVVVAAARLRRRRQSLGGVVARDVHTEWERESPSLFRSSPSIPFDYWYPV